MLRARTSMSISAIVVLMGVSMTALGTASATTRSPYLVTEYRYRSEAGDYIGQGLSAAVSDPAEISIEGGTGSFEHPLPGTGDGA